jgi:hypothetical protein
MGGIQRCTCALSNTSEYEWYQAWDGKVKDWQYWVISHLTMPIHRKMTAYDKYMYDNYYSIGTADDPYAGRKLNRKEVQLIKDPKSAYLTEYYVEGNGFYVLPIEASYNGLRTLTLTKLKVRYSWMDIQAAAKASGKT